MSGDVYDALVVGAGPAGSMTARELALRGARVLLVDKATFPRTKVCGCCLNPRALGVLDRAGLGSMASDLGALPLESMELAVGGHRAVIRHPLGVSLSREAMDVALIRSAQAAGVDFESGMKVTLLAGDGAEGRSLRLRREGLERQVWGRCLVAATGLAGTIAEEYSSVPNLTWDEDSKIGAGCQAPGIPDGYGPGRIWMACGREGYVGMVALEDGRLDLAAALSLQGTSPEGRPKIGQAAAAILASSGLPPVPGIEGLPWKGTPALTRRARSLAEGGVFRVGDSAGYVEPFTGEGMAWALAGGVALGEILAEGTDLAAAGLAWERAHRREIRDRQGICRAASRVLRSSWMMRALVPTLKAWPRLSGPVIRALHRA